MKRIIILAASLIAMSLHAQSIPTMAKPVTLAGSQGLNAAMQTKADVSGGELNEPVISKATISSPVITGGSASGVDLTNSTIIPGTATNTVSMQWLEARGGVYPDDFKTAADGSDDAPSINRAIASLGYKGGFLKFFPRVYDLKSPITQTVPVTWECVPSQNLGVGVPSENGESGLESGGTWFKVDQNLYSAITITGSVAEGSVINGCTFEESQPASSHPVSGSVGSWIPNIYPPVISINYVNGGVRISNTGWYGIYSGIYSDRSSRIIVDHAYGQWLHDGISIHHSYDVDRIYDVHSWSYWESGLDVLLYQESNLHLINLYRVDTPFVDHVFSIAANAAIYMGYDTQYDSSSPGGSTTKLHIGDLSCDKSFSCIYIDSGTYYSSFTADTVDFQGEDVSNAGLAFPQSTVINDLSPADIQIGKSYAQDAMWGFMNTPERTSGCGNIYIGSLIIDTRSLTNGSNYLVQSGECSSDASPVINFSSVPTILLPSSAGTVPWINGSATINIPSTTTHQ